MAQRRHHTHLILLVVVTHKDPCVELSVSQLVGNSWAGARENGTWKLRSMSFVTLSAAMSLTATSVPFQRALYTSP
jgi:hypothetical protein